MDFIFIVRNTPKDYLLQSRCLDLGFQLKQRQSPLLGLTLRLNLKYVCCLLVSNNEGENLVFPVILETSRQSSAISLLVRQFISKENFLA